MRLFTYLGTSEAFQNVLSGKYSIKIINISKTDMATTDYHMVGCLFNSLLMYHCSTMQMFLLDASFLNN